MHDFEFLDKIFKEGELESSEVELWTRVANYWLKSSARLSNSRLASTNPKGAVDLLHHQCVYMCWLFAWQDRFAGEVPRGWAYSSGVNRDLRMARDFKVELAPELMVAAITHPNPSVMLAAGTLQELTPGQLSVVLERADDNTIESNEILRVQKDLGVTNGDLRRAERLVTNKATPLRFLKDPKVRSTLRRLSEYPRLRSVG